MTKNNKVVLVYGNFNIIHPGHLRLLHFAKELGNKLVVGVFADKIAGNSAHISQDLRLKNIESISWVDESHLIDNDVSNFINRLRPDIVVKGKEFEKQINSELDTIINYGGKLIFSSGESNFSTFDLINKELSPNIKNKNNLPLDYLSTHDINVDDLISIVNKFSKIRALVLGDLIIDEYITCDPIGMSQEDPTIVVTPVNNKLFIGGAGIVAAHASGLGADVNFITISGNDQTYNYAKKSLNKFGVKTTINIDESRPTTLKQRYRCKGVTLLRVSHLHQGMIEKQLQDKLLQQFTNLADSIDLLIFSDFNYGCLPNSLINKIIEVAKKKNIFIVADSQSSSQIGDISRFQKMDLITPTEREARLSVQDYDSGLIVLAEQVQNKSKCKNLLLKIGENGVLIHTYLSDEKKWETDKIPALNDSPKDVAGAGDSMLISSSLALSVGANIWEAALIGSIAASIQVSRVGNEPITYTEIIQYLNK